MRGKIITITHKDNLEVGEPHQCHFNAYQYAMENECNFVCGWIGITPHCICEKDGEYIDPTLNRECEFKIFHTYTFEEIDDIFYAEESTFIPFMGNSNVIYDGMKKVEDVNEWFEYVIKISHFKPLS